MELTIEQALARIAALSDDELLARLDEATKKPGPFQRMAEDGFYPAMVKHVEELVKK
ncbi:hypothetical protein Aes012_237 [Aeromonas phage Aes012]|uniref:Uncharacterized protein n=1 Tax=Aeromonas phage Aes012 TaxID=1198014 RepID=I6ZRP8_9CAUD|nr:hypothetical protein Aes012_237 [Aeromonas phage Aes012]AFN69867.1 hypothetical protein Aes012_237 [Aeromonas phage Aes012]